MKKNVYLVQIGVSYSSPCFLPYSAGCIAAYLKQDDELTEHYRFPDIVVMRETVPDVLRRFHDPYLVAFSSYIWNFEYNKTVARALKAMYPEVLISFGGHQVSPDGAMLEEYPFIDFLQHGEGEETTALFLKALKDGTDLRQVPNLSFRENGAAVTTGRYTPCDLSSYPSPYLTGEFDGIMREFPDREFHATLETNRGCPYECAYCEWCFTKKIRPFPMEKVKAEIEWIASHHLKYTYCADANFGILDRDVEIAQYVVDMKKKYGYPDVFKPCYAKESDDNVFAAGYLLNKNNTDKGVTLAYQSLSDEALGNIGRKNLTLQRFEKLDIRYTEAGIPTYTELILGLPGETFESFCRGICTLLESGQNNSMTVYECQVYPNSRMGDPAYQKKHGIKTAVIPMLGIHYNPTFNGVDEHLEIVVETATMPKEDWVRAYMFAVVLQTFHHLGLLRFFAIYLRRERNVTYYDFYQALFRYIYNENQGFLHTLFRELYDRKADTDAADWTYQKDVFSSTGWYFEEGAFLELMHSGDVFWEDILPFLRSFAVPEPLFGELLNYQRSLLRTPEKNEADIVMHWNFYPYFEDQSGKTPLTPVNARLTARSDLGVKDWADYARRVVWFGKRWSAMLLTNPRAEIGYTQEDADE